MNKTKYVSEFCEQCLSERQVIKQTTEDELIEAIDTKRKEYHQFIRPLMDMKDISTAIISIAKENGWIKKEEKTSLDKAREEFEKFIKLREQDILKRQEVIQMRNFYEKAIEELIGEKQ